MAQSYTDLLTDLENQLSGKGGTSKNSLQEAEQMLNTVSGGSSIPKEDVLALLAIECRRKDYAERH